MDNLVVEKRISSDEVIEWLLKGDVSIQYQTYCDLFTIEREDLRDRIATEWWGHDTYQSVTQLVIGA